MFERVKKKSPHIPYAGLDTLYPQDYEALERS